MNPKVVILLANGFEEIEAVVPIDVFRRLDFDVVIAGAEKIVTGSHKLMLPADLLINQVNVNEFDAFILPGGMPGSINLRDNPAVIDIVKEAFSSGKIIGAICAAPIVLLKAGILRGKKATAHPSIKNELEGVLYTMAMTESSGNIITSKGPGASFEFAAKIAEMLGKGKEAKELLVSMFVKT